jgi:hypothetical protein
MEKRVKHRDRIFVVLLFLVGLASLNMLEGSIIAYCAGIIFLIVGTYGLASLLKNGRFIFD